MILFIILINILYNFQDIEDKDENNKLKVRDKTSPNVSEIQHLDDSVLEEMLKECAAMDHILFNSNYKNNENLIEMTEDFSDFDDVLANFLNQQYL